MQEISELDRVVAEVSDLYKHFKREADRLRGTDAPTVEVVCQAPGGALTSLVDVLVGSGVAFSARPYPGTSGNAWLVSVPVKSAEELVDKANTNCRLSGYSGRISLPKELQHVKEGTLGDVRAKIWFYRDTAPYDGDSAYSVVRVCDVTSQEIDLATGDLQAYAEYVSKYECLQWDMCELVLPGAPPRVRTVKAVK